MSRQRHPQGCDNCGRACGPTQRTSVHISLGKRWCHRCWVATGERRTAKAKRRLGWRRDQAGFWRKRV